MRHSLTIEMIQNYNKSSVVAEMAAQCCTSRIFAFEYGYLSLTHFYS